jgi:Asp-tRNA(Asn)/Glu-tRNA(Gln) amidotransferase A subunit family amidase
MSGAHLRPPIHLSAGAVEPEGLVDAVLAYEGALLADDVEALDAAFVSGPDALRADGSGLLVGSDAIAAFRRARGGIGPRTVERIEVRPVTDDAAVVVLVVAPASGGLGVLTQLWERHDRWLIAAAQVSAPAPAIDTRVWRTVGSPLVPGGASGPLAGETIAVKDLFEIEGFRVGAGNPTWLAEAPVATATAPALAALVDAGAAIRGIAQTDEFAYSIAGANSHYGTPPNPRVPGGLPGGSSSGPASAVASGQASIGLGTDTAGSVRVPASYNGLWGLRTTHGAVSRERLLPLADSFDTVGWLTRSPALLRSAAVATLGKTGVVPSGEFVVAPALVAVADRSVQLAFDGALANLAPANAPAASVDIGNIDELFETFRVVQAADAWRADGDWVTGHPGALGPATAARFAVAAAVTPAEEQAARAALVAQRARLDGLLGDRILLLPSASSAAPSATAETAELDRVRAATLRLCCIAGLTGRPALSVPVLSVPGPFGPDAPLGLCLVGPRGSDVALIAVAEQLVTQLS